MLLFGAERNFIILNPHVRKKGDLKINKIRIQLQACQRITM